MPAPTSLPTVSGSRISSILQRKNYGSQSRRGLARVRCNDLTDAQWRRLEPLLPPERPRTGRPNHNHRTILNGILWVLRTGAPWRDLPERYGPVGTVPSRFYRWRAAGL